MASPAITVSGLTKSYDATRAVDGLDLTVHRGEIFALLGPNGAGKTTTVEVLEGFRKRTAGDVTVLDEDPGTAGRAWRARLGIMLQDTASSTSLTVREAITHRSRLYAAPRDVAQVIAAVGLDDKADHRIPTLSGGQRRRLDVALAVVGSPELLFVDEPTTGFDPAARRQFWDLLRSLREDGTTIVLTTHYLDEADYLSDRVGVIAGGSLVALDTASGLRSRAAQTIVAWGEGPERREESTAEPTAFIRDLLARYQGELAGLEVRRPSLEDVYLDLIRANEGAAQ